MNVGFQMVTCCKCGKHYQCTPHNDYYNSTNLSDGVCESCLLNSVNLKQGDVITVICKAAQGHLI
jgi:NMD protein affecting ribosome stability and mRNA decay